MNQSFDQFLKFSELLHRYRAVERRILIQQSERLENDQEHSFNLAMLAWYICSTHKLDLDMEKIFAYALAHDLVEVYSGDVYVYETDLAKIANKSVKETESAERIRKEFPEFPELHNLIEEYEKKEDPESRFIYALDKLEPIMAIYTDGGRTWKRNGVVLETLINSKVAKVAIDPVVEKLFHELLVKLKEEEKELFAKE